MFCPRETKSCRLSVFNDQFLAVAFEKTDLRKVFSPFLFSLLTRLFFSMWILMAILLGGGGGGPRGAASEEEPSMANGDPGAALTLIPVSARVRHESADRRLGRESGVPLRRLLGRSRIWSGRVPLAPPP